MELRYQVAVVTGGASGLGRALCRRLAAEGAVVVVTDRDLEGAEEVAQRIGGTAFGADVTEERQLAALVAQVEQRVGPIDLFCCNAGVAVAGGFDAPDGDWARSLDLNLMAHVRAARVVVPDMLRRGKGYFLTVASAAGLLTQLGSAPYAVSKHAAVAFAEWLAVTYGAQGLRVSCVCPLGIRTPMLDASDPRIRTLLEPDALEPDQAADAIVAGIRREEFLILPHPVVREYLRRKWDDTDRWVRGMQRLQRRLDEAGPA